MLASTYALFSFLCLTTLAAPTNNNGCKRGVVTETELFTVMARARRISTTRISSSTPAGPASTSTSSTTTSSIPSVSGISCPAANGTTYTGSNNKVFTIQCYLDHAYGDLTTLKTSNLDVCITTCSTTAGCLAVSWIPSTGICYIKGTLMPGVSNTAIWGAVLSTSSVTSTTSTAAGVAKVTSSSQSSTLATSASSAASSTQVVASTSSRTSSSTSAVAPSSSGLPFNRIVAFGDNLSDNGNGSYAHGVSGNPATIYGYGTWTNGPVAVSYLSTLLSAPLTTDYAFGHANGGGLFGATIDNTYTNSTANAPDAFAQVSNYTSTGNLASIASTLHFLWIGANDINLYHINTGSSTNPGFATDMSTRMVKLVQNLVNAGAMHVVVPALYPKQISPSAIFYTGTPTQVQNLGLAISQANTAIQSALATAFPSGAGKPKVVYYDAYTFMLNLWNAAPGNGFTHAGATPAEFCDGFSQADWDLCMVNGGGSQFYWEQYLDPTTAVHQKVAVDMAGAIRAAYA